jgi:hypothetical protein
MVYVNARLYYILNVSNTNIGLCFLVEAKVVVFSSLTPNLIEEWKIKIKKLSSKIRGTRSEATEGV